MKKRAANWRSERNIAWIEKYCCVPDGKLVGQPVELTAEQRKWMAMIYDTPTRIFILSVGRKNAKTSFSAMLLLLHVAGPEAIPNSELYSAAQSRDQAGILFHKAVKMVRMSPELSDYITVRDTAKQLLCTELGTVYRALSADASTAYGLSPVFTVHDELGQVRGPRSELFEALETAGAANDHPLSIIISTQAPTDGDLLSKIIDDGLKATDPLVKCVLYTADEELDPFSEEAIRQANPHFGIFMNREEVLNQAKRAARMPEREASYRNLILNQRVNAVNPFISAAVWAENSGDPRREEFERGKVYMGLDLSSRNDLTARVSCVLDRSGDWSVLCRFYMPKDGLEEKAKRDRVPYDVWARQGLITLTPGASVGYEYVAKDMVEDCERWNVVGIAFDRWRIDVLERELELLGKKLPLIPFGQGYKDMSPALDVLEGLLLESHLRHGGNPVLTMCAANAVATRDPADNRKLDKSKATGRIDGLVALAMAVGSSSKPLEITGPSVYESRGLRFL